MGGKSWQLHPALLAVLGESSIDPDETCVAIKVDKADNSRIIVEPRNNIMISDGTNACEWNVKSLEGLFRGDVQPPDLGGYPAEYTGRFFIIEKHMITLCNIIGDQTDKEFQKVYSCLARRPDAKAGDIITDIVWQCAALMLALEPTSRTEYEAIMRRLAKSAKTWGVGQISRNYILHIREMLDGDLEV